MTDGNSSARILLLSTFLFRRSTRDCAVWHDGPTGVTTSSESPNGAIAPTMFLVSQGSVDEEIKTATWSGDARWNGEDGYAYQVVACLLYTSDAADDLL